jgi:hypothetical protein
LTRWRIFSSAVSSAAGGGMTWRGRGRQAIHEARSVPHTVR